MLTTELSIEIEQTITEAQHEAVGRLRGERLGRYKGSAHYILCPLTEAVAGNLWEYLCDEGVHVTLVRETRITCNAPRKAS